VEDDIAVRVPSQARGTRDLDPAEHERHPGPERVAVMPDPGPDVARPGQSGRHATQVGRECHLEIAWIAGDHMDRDATGFEQGGLIGEGLRAARGEPAIRLAQEIAPDALGGLGGAEIGPVDRLGDAARLDPA